MQFVSSWSTGRKSYYNRRAMHCTCTHLIYLQNLCFLFTLGTTYVWHSDNISYLCAKAFFAFIRKLIRRIRVFKLNKMLTSSWQNAIHTYTNVVRYINNDMDDGSYMEYHTYRTIITNYSHENYFWTYSLNVGNVNSLVIKFSLICSRLSNWVRL